MRTAGREHALLVAAENGGQAAVNKLISQARGGRALSPPKHFRREGASRAALWLEAPIAPN
ncbi:MAG: hypothetical protein ACLQFR_08090 [Streptosporangiaceae bacterium]